MPKWLDDLRTVLHDFYPDDGPQNVVGYLKGSADPSVWRIMAMQGREQQMVLGSVPLTVKEWVDAGKPGSEPIQTLTPDHFNGFIIMYNGGSPRPWGKIGIPDQETLKHYQTATLDNFRNSVARMRRR